MQVQSIQNRYYGLNQPNSTKMSSNPQAQTQVQNNSLPNYRDCVSFGMASAKFKNIAKTVLKTKYVKEAEEFLGKFPCGSFDKEIAKIEEMGKMSEGTVNEILLHPEKDILSMFKHDDNGGHSSALHLTNFVADYGDKDIKREFFVKNHEKFFKENDDKWFKAESGSYTEHLCYKTLNGYFGHIETLLIPQDKGQFLSNNSDAMMGLIIKRDFSDNILDIILQAGEHKEAFYKKAGLKPLFGASNLDYINPVLNQINTLKPEVQKEIFIRDGLEALYSKCSEDLSRKIMSKLLSFGDDTVKIYLDKGAEVVGNLLKKGQADVANDFLNFAATKLKQEPKSEFCSKHGLKIYKSAVENSQPEVAGKALDVIGTLEQGTKGKFLSENGLEMFKGAAEGNHSELAKNVLDKIQGSDVLNQCLLAEKDGENLYTLTRKSGDTKLLEKLINTLEKADDTTQDKFAEIIEKAEANLKKEAAEAQKAEKK